MNRGFFSMIQKHNGKVKSGTQQIRHAQIKPRKANPRSSQCSLLFSTFEVLCIRNLCLKDRKSIKLTTVRFLRDWEKGSFVAGQRLLALGCLITITLHVTPHFLWTSIWPKRAFLWYPIHLTSLFLVHVIIPYFQNSKVNSEAAILEVRRTSKRLWRTSYRQWQLKTSSTVSILSLIHI